MTAAVAAVAREMVVIPAGRFRMGCVSGRGCLDREFPVHEVTIPEAFAVSVIRGDVCAVGTRACWVAVVADIARTILAGAAAPAPVILVSWEDAQEYVGWLSRQTGEAYRLLSESEWEYVVRAWTSTVYSWGNAIGSNRANCNGCGSQWDYRQTAPVGSFPANAYGVHDMHGNVYEWVEDCWNDSYAGAPSDGGAWRSGDCSERVLRDGFLEPHSEVPALRAPQQTPLRGPVQLHRLPRGPDAHALNLYLPMSRTGFSGGCVAAASKSTMAASSVRASNLLWCGSDYWERSDQSVIWRLARWSCGVSMKLTGSKQMGGV